MTEVLFGSSSFTIAVIILVFLALNWARMKLMKLLGMVAIVVVLLGIGFYFFSSGEMSAWLP